MLDVKEAAILHKYMTAAGNCIDFEDPGKYSPKSHNKTISLRNQGPDRSLDPDEDPNQDGRELRKRSGSKGY